MIELGWGGVGGSWVSGVFLLNLATPRWRVDQKPWHDLEAC